MLLYKCRPNELQGFGDYLKELGYKNGFSNVKKFKKFLANSSKRTHYIYCSYSGLVRIISGLFIELGLDHPVSDGIQRPQCFGCLNQEPKHWNCTIPDLARCEEIRHYCHLIDTPRDEFQSKRENYCGLMMCSTKKLGLNFSPAKEGRYYADILSKEEREGRTVPEIYPPHMEFTNF